MEIKDLVGKFINKIEWDSEKVTFLLH